MGSLMGEGDTCPYLLLRVRPYAAVSASLHLCRWILYPNFSTPPGW